MRVYPTKEPLPKDYDSRIYDVLEAYLPSDGEIKAAYHEHKCKRKGCTRRHEVQLGLGFNDVPSSFGKFFFICPNNYRDMSNEMTKLSLSGMKMAAVVYRTKALDPPAILQKRTRNQVLRTWSCLLPDGYTRLTSSLRARIAVLDKSLGFSEQYEVNSSQLTSSVNSRSQEALSELDREKHLHPGIDPHDEYGSYDGIDTNEESKAPESDDSDDMSEPEDFPFSFSPSKTSSKYENIGGPRVAGMPTTQILPTRLQPLRNAPRQGEPAGARSSVTSVTPKRADKCQRGSQSASHVKSAQPEQITKDKSVVIHVTSSSSEDELSPGSSPTVRAQLREAGYDLKGKTPIRNSNMGGSSSVGRKRVRVSHSDVKFDAKRAKTSF